MAAPKERDTGRNPTPEQLRQADRVQQLPPEFRKQVADYFEALAE